MDTRILILMCHRNLLPRLRQRTTTELTHDVKRWSCVWLFGIVRPRSQSIYGQIVGYAP